MTNSRNPLTILCLGASVGLACVPADEPVPITQAERDSGPPACTLEAYPATIVHVMQGMGDHVEPLAGEATVLYRSWSEEEGWSEVEEAWCINEACTVASLGFGEPGSYAIGAFGCGDYALTAIEVGETADGCHVDTVTTPIVLDEIDPWCMGPDELSADEPATSPPADPLLACPMDSEEPTIIASTGVLEQDILWPWTPTEMGEPVVSNHGRALPGGLQVGCPRPSTRDR